MREIKFRVWSNVQNKFIQLEKMIGRYPQEYFHSNYVLGFDGKVYLVNGCGYFNCGDDLIAQQFTGLKDKNGKEIYEGDILGNSGETKDEVKWEDGYFSCWGDSINCLDTTREKIIGNIYENPELLSLKSEEAKE